MTAPAALRRLAMRSAGRLGVLAVAACVALVLPSTLSSADAQAPYPPTTPCALSFSSSPSDSSSTQPASPGTDSVLVGSGLGRQQAVDVTLYPQGRQLGRYVTDASGAFQATVDVSDDSASWLTARSASTSCSTHTPGTSGGGRGPSTTPTSPTNGAPTTAAPSTQPASGASPAPTPAGAPTVGTGRTGGPGSTPGAAGGAASGSTPTIGPYPPRGSPASSSSTGAGDGAGATTTPPASGAGNGTPSASPSAYSTPHADDSPAQALGLSTPLIITIAALLLLAGGLGVLFLTRRSG